MSVNNFSPVAFICDTLPPEPAFGWMDTTTNNSKNIIYWAYNPTNNSEIIYVDYSGNLFSYDLYSKNKVFLDKQIMGIPKISKKGWVAYGKLNFCIYIIKTNGDSLTQLNKSMSGQNPNWDFTGNYIFYLQDNLCMKVDMQGNKVDSLNFNSTGAAFANNSNSHIDLTNNNLKLVNTSTLHEIYLTTNPSSHHHLCFDKNDQNLFWWNQKGLMRCNVTSKKIDTLLKFCENYSVAGLNISPGSNKLTMGYYQLKQIGSPWKLYRKIDPIEYDLKTGKWRKLNVNF